MNHLTLEHEIAEELTSFPIANGKNTPAMCRETVLSMLSQSAQVAHNFIDLLNEAGFLASAVMEMNFFAGAEILPTNDVRISFASVTGHENNAAPTLHDLDWDPARSSFQLAIESGHPIVVEDAANDDRFVDTILTSNGIKSGVICPIDYRDQHYGALGFFSAAQRTFSRDEVLFFHSVALFLGPARAHQKTERTLAEQTRFLSSAIDSLDAMVVMLNADGGILQINRACQSLGGFTLADLRGRRIWSAFWRPEECASAEVAIGEIRAGVKQAKREAYFVTKQGATRRVNWTFAKLQTGNGTGPAILATGIDVTDQYNALKRLEETSRGPKNIGNYYPQDDPPTKRSPAEPGSVDPRDRREHERRPYQCIQMIAPCLGGQLPALDQFREVKCYDISPAGFSFLLTTKPSFEELVAAFGLASSSRLYLRAVIRHVTPIQYEGRKVLLVGCEYVGRVRMPHA